MPTYPYSGFLTDEREYRRAEAFWHEAIEAASRKNGQESDWKPWGAQAYANGTPFPLDGNPIVALRSNRLRRAIRVIQWPPTKTTREISAWMGVIDYLLPPGIDRFDELVINVLLSLESSATALRLIDRWIDPTNTLEAMKLLIDEIARPEDASR